MINMNNLLKCVKSTIMTVPLLLLSTASPINADGDVTINGDGSYDILGYSAGGNITYSADVFWEGNLTFVFDKGTFDSETGGLKSSFGSTGEITSAMVEKGASAGTLNKWYGFDGVKNRVLVLNRSNAAITASYAATAATENPDIEEIALELYDYDANNAGYLVTLATEDEVDSDTDETIVYAGDPQSEYLYAEADKTARFGNNTKLTNGATKTLPAAPGDGTMYANKVFLNITGTPGENFPTQEAETPGTIGTITITLNKVD